MVSRITSSWSGPWYGIAGAPQVRHFIMHMRRAGQRSAPPLNCGVQSSDDIEKGAYIDPATGEPHIHNHRVAESEVEAVLARPGEDRPGSDGARIAVGRTSAGRYLRVIYVAEAGGVFVVTAYELTGKPLLAYRRRKRRKR